MHHVIPDWRRQKNPKAAGEEDRGHPDRVDGQPCREQQPGGRPVRDAYALREAWRQAHPRQDPQGPAARAALRLQEGPDVPDVLGNHAREEQERQEEGRHPKAESHEEAVTAINNCVYTFENWRY